MRLSIFLFVFFFNDTATTEIYTLSLHDALPISLAAAAGKKLLIRRGDGNGEGGDEELASRGCSSKLAATVGESTDRKSTRLNSSHLVNSYAVFCLKKKKKMILRAQHTSTYSGSI